MPTSPPQPWSLADAFETYGVRSWGAGYFGINDKGNVTVHADGNGHSMDLKELVEEVRRRGISLPLLIRFTDVLRSRVVHLNESFRRAISEHGYRGSYRGVYPIKVNQHRYVAETIVEAGRPYDYGLEAGSKPELLAVMALLDSPEALIICNGYKDEEYIETALYASRLGRKVVLVVEKPSEIPLIAEVARRVGIRPCIGIRVKLSTRGAGKWEASGGDRSKFGLSSSELVDSMEFMRKVGLLDCFELLHFHLGSQVSNIRNFKNALREASRFYVEVAQAGAPLKYLDVGGGLGVDYDGSQTNFTSSMNYTTQEYANDVVFSVLEACNEANVEHPTLVSESGRAVVAHHAVLVTEVLGVSEFDAQGVPETLPEDATPVVRKLWATYRELTRKNVLEAYHDATEYKEECLTLFSLGHLTLADRVAAENLFWAVCQKVLKVARELDDMPEELETLERQLADTYFCNFSVFQSLPDSWAIDQLFPIMPIHRLEERPTRRATIQDVTCDSDGKIDRFVGERNGTPSLDVHEPRDGEAYMLGVFLTGAYQEILGDLHNLFGDTNAVHIRLSGNGGYSVTDLVHGDTVTEVLNYVQFRAGDLLSVFRRKVNGC